MLFSCSISVRLIYLIGSCCKGGSSLGQSKIIRQLRRQNQGESASLAFNRIDFDSSAEQAGELPANGQAEACAAVFAAGCSVRLLEGFEDTLQLGGGDTNPCIADSEDNLVAACPD